MAITSENSKTGIHSYRSSHFYYAMTYVAVTLAILIILNVYSSSVSQRLIYRSKEHSLVEKCQLTSGEISSLKTIDSSTISNLLEQMDSLKVTRLIVTDRIGDVLYDSIGAAVGSRALLPEVIQALGGDSVFSGDYKKGLVICRSATPILHYGNVIGSVYMSEYDVTQGALIRNLQVNIFQITFALESFMILFSLIYSGSFAGRIGKIINSMRIIHNGDYSHKVAIGGHDELTVLGREFNELTTRLQASEETRRRFVSDASHEIKTPLASIKLLADSILQNPMDSETVREFVEDIGNEADRLNRMTEKLLTLSKIDRDSPEKETEIIYMKPTVSRVCRILIPTANAAGVKMEIALTDDCPVLILEDDLYQIVFNLMENGIKYNVRGGTLTVRLFRSEDNAVLTIADTGMGIPPEALEHIFDRFYRVDKARSRATGGSGLGLAIVQAIVQRNQGLVQVDSVPGKGTCFTVTFPLFDTEAVL